MATSSTLQGVQQAYSAQGAPIANVFPVPVIATRDPTTTDINYKIGREWINKTTPSIWFLGAKVSGSATWIAAGSGSTGAINTITGDTGGALSPSAGNMNIIGTSAQGLSFAGSGSTLTGTISDWTTAQKGVGILSSNAQAVTGTGTTQAVTPAALTARLQAPGAIGGTTPGAATFTTITTSGGLNIPVIANGRMGTGTLALGTLVVANTSVTANTKVLPVRIAANGSTTLGILSYTISAGVGFTVTSLIVGTPASPQTADISTFWWMLIESA